MTGLKINSIRQNARYLGKYLDQTALIEKFYNSMPIVLGASALGYCAFDTYKADKEKRKDKFIQTASVMGLTVASALLATRGLKFKGKQIFEGIIELPENDVEGLSQVLSMPLNKQTKELVEKVNNGKILKFREVKTLMQNLEKQFQDKNLIQKIIPNAESEEPFSDLLKLSWLGLIPVIGGISGGILGDKLAGKNWKDNLPNKIKEGMYQYLNNIALCNVGAGMGAFVMNVLDIKSKMARVASMLVGVLGVGLVAGNAIANYICKKFIDPIFDKNTQNNVKDKKSDRHPETLDLCLHVDDLASVGFVSGFKWIGPILPILYSISAFRAGIGYRNGEK